MDKDLETDFRRMMIMNNLAYLLADVSNTFCLEAESRFNRVGKTLAKKEKLKFSRMKDATRNLKIATKELTREFYRVETVDLAVEDSDWFAQLILLIVDRIGEDDGSQQRLTDLIRTSFQSKTHILGD